MPDREGAAGQRGIAYEEFNRARDPEGRAELVRPTGMMAFPQFVIDGRPLGVYQELVKADRDGVLETWPARLAPARPGLTALTHVGSPPAARSLRTARPSARTARLAHVDQEAVLERAADPVGSRKSSIVAPFD